MEHTPALVDLPPTTWYRRQLIGAGLSLEANTGAVPSPGRFYVLRSGRNLFSSADFKEAVVFYHRLCAKYWEEQLQSNVSSDRLAAAWGLLDLDYRDERATAVIQTDGDAGDRERLTQIRRRSGALARRARTRGGVAIRG
jgi:hypothetical protein